MHFNKNLFSLTSEVRKKFFLGITSGFAGAFFTIYQALLLARIINNVFLNNNTLSEVKGDLLLFLLISFLKALAIWGEQIFASDVVKHIKEKVRKTLLDKITKLSKANLTKERTGELSNTIIKGVDLLEKYFSQYLPQLFLSALIPILILFFVFPRDLLSGIIFVLTAPLIPLFMYLIGSIAENLNKKQFKELSRMSAYFLDVIQGIVTLKLFNAAKRELEKIARVSEAFRSATMKVLRVAFLSAFVLELLSTISIAVISVEIGLRLLAGHIQFIDAMFLLIIAPEFYLPFRQLGTRYHAGLEGVAAFKRIENILAIKEPVEGKENISFDLRSSNISFENVTFRYGERTQNALDKVTFSIEPLQTTAIVGPTGAGKSTIFNLLLKFISPSEGEIKIGKSNLSNLTTSEWRKFVSWLPQNPHLFQRTILENIKIAKPSATLEEVISAAKKARIHDFIESLPEGYGTNPGEAGAKLSGGQIQRIALARAFLKDAPLLLIDEPTANLDPFVEEQILEALTELMKERTVLIIAHRLNTVRNADKIILLDHGKINACGTHEELIEKSDFYKKMFHFYRSA